MACTCFFVFRTGISFGFLVGCFPTCHAVNPPGCPEFVALAIQLNHGLVILVCREKLGKVAATDEVVQEQFGFG